MAKIKSTGPLSDVRGIAAVLPKPALRVHISLKGPLGEAAKMTSCNPRNRLLNCPSHSMINEGAAHHTVHSRTGGWPVSALGIETLFVDTSQNR